MLQLDHGFFSKNIKSEYFVKLRKAKFNEESKYIFGSPYGS